MRSSLAKVWQLDFSEFEAMFGHPLADLRGADEQTGEIKPGVTIVTDNGGPFRSFRFEAFIAAHPELTHVRTRVKSPGQKGSRERGLGTLKYDQAVSSGPCVACDSAGLLRDSPSDAED